MNPPTVLDAMPTPQDANSGRPPSDARRAVRIWLMAVAALVALMVTIGGATRLTGSGLSITEWQPIVGTIPPITEAAWHEAFEKYKAIPQYREINRGMTIEAFKGIFWWEWGHRFLGRFVGLVFAVPLIAFWLTGKIEPHLRLRLLSLLALGGLQGAMGWYMVKSGLVDRVSVSQYRLTLHLGLAFLLLGLLVWTAADMARNNDHQAPPATDARPAAWILGLIYLQVLLGALVAGLKAGLTHNTWPLMDGALIPSGLLLQQPWFINLFENPTTVQFNHRLAAYIVVAATLWHALAEASRGNADRTRSATSLAAAALLQAALGVWTLLSWVPLWLGLLHQAGAVLVFTVAVLHFHRLRSAH